MRVLSLVRGRAGPRLPCVSEHRTVCSGQFLVLQWLNRKKTDSFLKPKRDSN